MLRSKCYSGLNLGEQGNRRTGDEGNLGTGEQESRGTREQGNRGTEDKETAYLRGELCLELLALLLVGLGGLLLTLHFYCTD